MMESGLFDNGNFQEYSYFARGVFAVLEWEFPVALFQIKLATRWFSRRLEKAVTCRCSTTQYTVEH